MTLHPDAISWRRKWTAIAVATLLVAVSTWSLVLGVVASDSDELDAPAAGPPIAVGLALGPLVFLALALLSRHREAPVAVLKAMGLALAAALFVSVVAQDIVTGVVAAYGAGGVAALRSEPVHNWKARSLGVALAVVYVFVLVRVVAPLGVALAPFTPLTAVAIADIFVEYRAANSPQG